MAHIQKYLLPVLMLAALLLPSAGSRAAEPQLAEAALPPFTANTQLRELNTGADGQLFVSDYLDGAVWKVNPLTGAAVQYLYAASLVGADAQPDSAGRVWYTEMNTDLGYFETAQCNAAQQGCAGKIWEFPKDTNDNLFNLGALAVDEQNRIWAGLMATSSTALLFRLNPNANPPELCSYNLGNYRTVDVRYRSGEVWLGDYTSGRILRYDLDVQKIHAWSLPDTGKPGSLTFAADGAIWWADTASARLGRLAPASQSNNVRYYPLPTAGKAQSVVERAGMLYYAGTDGSAGRLDPATAAHTSHSVTPVEVDFSSSCQTLAPQAVGETAYFISSSTLDFTPLTLTPTQPSTGWLVYSLPQGAKLNGSATAGDHVWMSDEGRGKLVRFTFEPPRRYIYLPMVIR